MARERIAAAAESLAGKWGLDLDLTGLHKPHRDPRLRGLFQIEAIAPIIEALDTVQVPVLEERGFSRDEIVDIVLGIPGLTKTSQVAIVKWADEEADEEE